MTSKSAKELYRYFRSGAAERIGLAPKAPWVIDAKNIKGLEHWKAADAADLPYRPWKPDRVRKYTKEDWDAVIASMAAGEFWSQVEIIEAELRDQMWGVYDAALGPTLSKPANPASLLGFLRRSYRTLRGLLGLK